MDFKHSPDTCLIRAPAKINLGLRIVGRRNDGYHDIDTVFAAINLYDDLRFERRMSGGLHLTWEPGRDDLQSGDFACNESNMIVRAVRCIENTKDFTAHLAVHVTKRIPIAAGLGGGSADAAATLVACNHLLGLDSSLGQLHEWAAGLGADVPFFLGSWCARGSRRGDELHAVECPKNWHAVLVCPPVHLSAGEVYGALRLTERPSVSDTAHRVSGDGFPAAIGGLHNDLEVVVTDRVPDVVLWRGRLSDLGARRVFVSGSGPTVVGLFDDPPDIAPLVRVRKTGDQVLAVRPVDTPTALMIELSSRC